jgi:hypothetical protein
MQNPDRFDLSQPSFLTAISLSRTDGNQRKAVVQKMRNHFQSAA